MATNEMSFEKAEMEKSGAISPQASSLEAVQSTREGAVEDRIVAPGLDADEALKAFQGLGDDERLELTPETSRRLLWKIDLHLMPIMCAVYALNYLDKTTLSYASIMGLQTDIHINSSQYSWLGSMFYFGYLIWEYPTNRLLQRLPLAKYSAFCVIMWGVTLTLFSTVTNFSGALAVRFFLGLLEAAVTPGFALFTSQWYTQSEQGFRTAIWFSFNGVAQVIGGLVAYGIANGSNLTLAPWKIMFLLTGLLTVCVGIVFGFVMPDNQLNARWLTKAERVLAVERVRVNQQGIGNKHFKWYQFKEAMLDPISWCFFFYALIIDIPNGGISNFFSLLIVSFGFTPKQSLLYATPAGAVEVIALIIAGYLWQRTGKRLFVGLMGIAVALVGAILLVALPASKNGGRLAGYYLTQAFVTGFVALLSLVSSNVAGYTKKTTVAAMLLIGYCVGNIIGPQTFRNNNYVPAEITIIVCFALSAALLCFIWFWYHLQNKRKAAIRSAPGYVKRKAGEWLDQTDKENPEFIYVT